MNLRILPSILLLLLLCCGDAAAQPGSTGNDRGGDTTLPGSFEPGGGTTGTRPWYDTLKVTHPRYVRITGPERLALAAFTAISIPAGIAIGATTIVPPSINVLWEKGEASRTGIAFSSGYGFGGDTADAIFFPTMRLQMEIGYYFTRRPQPIARAALLFDKPIASIHKRDFFWLGVAGGAGVASDFKSFSPYAEGWVGVMNPMGIRFLTLFPMHNYGLRGRAGYNFATDGPWYEVAICATSTFW